MEIPDPFVVLQILMETLNETIDVRDEMKEILFLKILGAFRICLNTLAVDERVSILPSTFY